MKVALNVLGVWPDEQELTEALRIKRVLLCESPPDSDLVSAFAMNRIANWGLIEKQYQVIATQGANDNIVVRMQAVVEILNKLLSGNVCVAYLRDRDLMWEERKEKAEQQSLERGLSLIITQRRNRESYLVEPKVVESAVMPNPEKVPSTWQHPGKISKLVTDWCLEYCKSEINALAPKVRDFNQQWLRTQFLEDSERKSAETRLEAFIQDNWYKKIQSDQIPWKLMDGRGALGFVRQKLQEKGLTLSDASLFAQLKVVPVPEDFAKLIDVIKSWPCPK